MSYCFSDDKRNKYDVAYLDASVLGGVFFDGLFLTVTTGKYVDVKIDPKFKEGFMCFNEEYWVDMAKEYIQNDIDYVTFLAEPDCDCETELYLEFVADDN